MRILTVLLAAALLLAGCGSNGDDMTMLEARDHIREVVEDLAVSLGGTVTVLDEYVTQAADAPIGDDDELRYVLSLDVDVEPPEVRKVVEDELADRYRDLGWTVELDRRPDVPLRLTEDGALVAITSTPERHGAWIVGTSAVVPTPEEVRPLTAKLPFEAYTPP